MYGLFYFLYVGDSCRSLYFVVSLHIISGGGGGNNLLAKGSGWPAFPTGINRDFRSINSKERRHFCPVRISNKTFLLCFSGDILGYVAYRRK